MKKCIGLIAWIFTTLVCTQQNANYDELKIPAYVPPEALQCGNGETVNITTGKNRYR